MVTCQKCKSGYFLKIAKLGEFQRFFQISLVSYQEILEIMTLCHHRSTPLFQMVSGFFLWFYGFLN